MGSDTLDHGTFKRLLWHSDNVTSVYLNNFVYTRSKRKAFLKTFGQLYADPERGHDLHLPLPDADTD